MDQVVHGHLLTPHALLEMGRRGIEIEIVAGIIDVPGQRIALRPGREVLQSRPRS